MASVAFAAALTLAGCAGDDDATGSASTAEVVDGATAGATDAGEPDVTAVPGTPTGPGGPAAGPDRGGEDGPAGGRAEPETLAMEQPRLAERLCALDPRVVLASAPGPDADAEELREWLDAVRDPLDELRSSLPAVEGGTELADLLDAVAAGWAEAIRASDAGDEDAADRSVERAAADLDAALARSDVVLAACGDR